MDKCLLNDDEWAQWVDVMSRKDVSIEDKQNMLVDIFDDGFEDWVDGEAVDHDHDHDHHMDES